jgi:hypothetical protein
MLLQMKNVINIQDLGKVQLPLFETAVTLSVVVISLP